MILPPVIATATSIFIVLTAAFTMVGEFGYGFDLRRQTKRRITGRQGGRRSEDARA